MTPRLSRLVLATALIASTAYACMWDRDTLRDERRGLPGIAEVIAGKWEQHSAFYYEDRVKRSQDRLNQDRSDAGAWDDLSVAYAKLGQVDKAIDTILAKDKIRPGLYETHSNVGTFYMFAGRLEESIVELKKALQINPNAHFGREKYQLQLAEYLLDANASPDLFATRTFITPTLLPATLPAGDDDDPFAATQPTTQVVDDDAAATMVLNRVHAQRHTPDAPDSRAIEAVVGMIRFGANTSPHLYAALGDLLLARGDLHLAYRAYQRASDLGYPASAFVQSRLKIAASHLEDKSELDPAIIDEERKAAQAWVAAYQAFEDNLIRAGKDPTDENLLAPFYKEYGSPRDSLALSPSEFWRDAKRSGLLQVAAAVSCAIGAVFLLRVVRKRQAPASGTIS